MLPGTANTESLIFTVPANRGAHFQISDFKRCNFIKNIRKFVNVKQKVRKGFCRKKQGKAKFKGEQRSALVPHSFKLIFFLNSTLFMRKKRTLELYNFT